MTAKLDGSEPFDEAIVTIAENNPGAMTVLANILKVAQDDLEKLQMVYTVDAMNLRGPALWLAWKDWASYDTQMLITGIQTRDPGMIEMVNTELAGMGETVTSDVAPIATHINGNLTTLVPVGGGVVCDDCDEDWTTRPESGGIMFQSKAICPECAPKWLKGAEKHGELRYVKGTCPEGMSFADWIRDVVRSD